MTTKSGRTTVMKTISSKYQPRLTTISTTASKYQPRLTTISTTASRYLPRPQVIKRTTNKRQSRPMIVSTTTSKSLPRPMLNSTTTRRHQPKSMKLLLLRKMRPRPPLKTSLSQLMMRMTSNGMRMSVFYTIRVTAPRRPERKLARSLTFKTALTTMAGISAGKN